MTVQERPDELIRILRPEFTGMAEVNEAIAINWLRIWVVPNDGTTPQDFDPDTAGFTAAIVFATANGTAGLIWMPPCTIGDNHTVPENYTVASLAIDRAIFSGTITLENGAALVFCELTQSGSSSDDLICVQMPASGAAYLQTCPITVVNSGSGDAIGVNLPVGDAVPIIDHCIITATASGAGLGYAIKVAGGSAGPAVLTQIDTYDDPSSTTIFGSDVGEYSATSPGNSWSYANYHLDVSSLPAYNNGQLRVTIYADEAHTTTVSLMQPQPPGTYSPNLTGDTSGPGALNTGQSATCLGTPNDVFQSGYWAQRSGWESYRYPCHFHITKIEWYDATTTLVHNIWEPASTTSAVAKVIFCTLNGSDYDLYTELGGQINFHACQYDHLKISGTINPLPGDRSAWDVDNTPDYHGSDIYNAVYKVHLPDPGNAGNVVYDDGDGWVSDTPENAGLLTELPDHDHSGDAGDGGTFDAANLTSGASTDGQVLTSDGAGGAAWEDPAGGSLALDDLTDVNAPAPNDGDALVWDDGAGEWVNGAVASGGQYRQFLYYLDGLGDFVFLIDDDGNPLMGLLDLE